jgi:hypothetical protein
MNLTVRYDDGAVTRDAPQARGHLTRKLTSIVGRFAELYYSGDERAVYVMSHLRMLWGDNNPEIKAEVQAQVQVLIAELAPGPLLAELFPWHQKEEGVEYPPSAHFLRPARHEERGRFGLYDLDLDQLQAEQWDVNIETSDDVVIEWFEKMFKDG